MITHFLYVFQYVEENEMEVIMVRSFAVHGKIFKERFFFQTLRSIAIKSSSSSTQYLSEENVWLWIALGENRNVPMFPCRWEEQKPFFCKFIWKLCSSLCILNFMAQWSSEQCPCCGTVSSSLGTFLHFFFNFFASELKVHLCVTLCCLRFFKWLRLGPHHKPVFFNCGESFYLEDLQYLLQWKPPNFSPFFVQWYIPKGKHICLDINNTEWRMESGMSLRRFSHRNVILHQIS